MNMEKSILRLLIIMACGVVGAFGALGCSSDSSKDNGGNGADSGADGDADSDTDGGADAGDGGIGLDASICDPANGPFSTDITHPFFPLVVGQVSVLEGMEGTVLLRVERTVLPDAGLVDGVTVRVLEEREFNDDVLVEISRNFFVQTQNGTVCYFGEDVDIYADGGVVAHDGAWRAGDGESKAGIMMPASPKVGMTYQQEDAPGVAQDRGRIVKMGESLTVPAGTFTDTLEVAETSALETGVSRKVYVHGIGMAVDETIELKSY